MIQKKDNLVDLIEEINAIVFVEELHNNMKNNFYYVTIVIIGLVIALASFVSINLTNNPNAEVWFERGLWIGQTAGFFMLFFNGTFIKTKYFRILKGIIAIIIIGALIKILHWEFQGVSGNNILTVGFIGIMITYFFSFLNKPIKRSLDFLKLVWVITSYTIGILIILHVIRKDYRMIPSVIMWMAILNYFILENKKGKLFE
ncbi:hypothetical protein HX109_09540 [Galbibacter sp. BG1]|uniref:GldL-related protein n=1 Tax=Galbibacter sp. BG1 TaxID=1170699 RepID=UPI0015B9B063|nr:hypothetical protein [Galbibacter sp. BG1]QLE01787.1 hypothetical protein HX109_09540 [Galbibacter sp. BG1]